MRSPCCRVGWPGRFCYIRTGCRTNQIVFSCKGFKRFALSREVTQNSSSPGRVQVRSAIMSDTATIASKQNPLQYVTDELKDFRAKGVAPKLRVLEGEQKPVCIFDGKEVINLASNNYLGLT